MTDRSGSAPGTVLAHAARRNRQTKCFRTRRKCGAPGRWSSIYRFFPRTSPGRSREYSAEKNLSVDTPVRAFTFRLHVKFLRPFGDTPARRAAQQFEEL